MKLKLDLHTHCHEATYLCCSTDEAARRIGAKLRARGIDGLAITDHLEVRWAYSLRDTVKRLFGEEFVIIPGQEVARGNQHIVELYLDGDTTFRFIAHPTNPGWEELLTEAIHGLEVENPHWAIDKEKVKDVAAERGLLLLSNSDAHSLEAVGLYYNTIDLDHLVSLAKGEQLG